MPNNNHIQALPTIQERFNITSEQLADIISRLPANTLHDLVPYLEDLERRSSRRRLFTMFPETGPYRRELYVKHMDFYAAGSRYRFRGLFGGNRTGKTIGAGTEATYHLTGLYPDWWIGHRFEKPISAWACGDSWDRVKSVVQAVLLRSHKGAGDGTGLIPGDLILKKMLHGAKAETYRELHVKHVTGGTSVVEFKSYEQSREMFQGEPVDLIWLDEEPPENIEAECTMRTMATGHFKGGIVMQSFTPLRGMSNVVLKYLPNGKMPEDQTDAPRFVVCVGWDDVPHIDPAEKERMLKECEPHLVEARSKGIPSIGSGLIYPVPDEHLVVDPFMVPNHWPRAFGLDVGWNRWACVWGAIDRASDILYLTDEYCQGQQPPAVHLAAIKARGGWIPGVCDPASKAKAQDTGGAIFDSFYDSGLNITIADNTVESIRGNEIGIYGLYRRMTEGRLKVFSTLRYWFEEKGVYRRDEKGRVVKDKDHLMDATRYLANSGIALATCYMPHVTHDYSRDTVGGIYN